MGKSDTAATPMAKPAAVATPSKADRADKMAVDAAAGSAAGSAVKAAAKKTPKRPVDAAGDEAAATPKARAAPETLATSATPATAKKRKAADSAAEAVPEASADANGDAEGEASPPKKAKKDPNQFGSMHVEADAPTAAAEDDRFDSLEVSDATKNAIREMNFTRMTEIQRYGQRSGARWRERADSHSVRLGRRALSDGPVGARSGRASRAVTSSARPRPAVARRSRSFCQPWR